MTRVADESSTVDAAPGAGPSLWTAFGGPALVAITVTVLAVLAIVSLSKSAWALLGAGRGFVPEEYYHVWAFVLIAATCLGQAAGWAAGTAVVYLGLVRIGFPPGGTSARLAASAVYLGLAAVPLLVYHVLFGGWLLGLPRTGLEEWLAEHHRDAYWLLVTAHGPIDLAVGPLAIAFLGLLWGPGRRVLGLGLKTAVALVLLATSLAVALSLAIHSTLVHIRL